MNAQALPATPAVEGCRCHVHPDQPALGACTRCGVFFCDQELRLVGGTPYCATCAARPDVDYLEAFRLQHWGKRDPWTWLVGMGAMVNLLGAVPPLLAARSENLLAALFSLGTGVVGIFVWLGKPWARLAFLAMPVVSLVIMLVMVGPQSLVLGILPLGISIVIFRDTRYKLFFKLDVPREALLKAWDLHVNNPLARTGLFLGLLGLFIPVIGLFAMTCSFVGLHRVDPHAHPPIGRKGQALAGIVLGAVGCLIWGTVLVFSLL